MIEQMGLKGATQLKIPGVKEEKTSDRELREDIDMMINKNEYPYENHIIKDTGIQRETNEHIESMCGRCHTEFNSRNELFKHWEETNHMVTSDGDVDSHIDRPANKTGSRKLSCSDRKFKQLSIHKRENFEEERSSALVTGWDSTVGRRMMRRTTGPLRSPTHCLCHLHPLALSRVET